MTPFLDQEGVNFDAKSARLVEHGKKPARAGLVCPSVRNVLHQRDADARLSEFQGLAAAIALDVQFAHSLTLREIKPATYLGSGQVVELAKMVEEHDIKVIVVDAPLTPIQQRNLEERLGAKVLDRTALILEIFGARAATREGVLQVELAHLNYQRGRLVKSWTHLERQRGGGGFMGGPGETQIESDRRQLQNKIGLLEDRLEKVRKTRDVQRKPRDGVPFPVVALVGYTNSGKSTLFNRMTGAEVMAKDLLFATLDTTVRRIELPHGRDAILSDTVGFIADLPTDLVAAFRATLEEVTEADIIVHVRDAASPDRAPQATDVLKVLKDLGIDANVPVIEVWNKVDLLPKNDDGEIVLDGMATVGKVDAVVSASALTGEGVETFLLEIERILGVTGRVFEVNLPHTKAGLNGWLYKYTEVLEQGESGDEVTPYSVRVQPRHYSEFISMFNAYLSASDAA